MSFIEITKGSGPIVLGFPHSGTQIAPSMRADLNENGALLADTDWHIHKLYQGLLAGATSVRTLVHRYVIDANRDPEGISLYPGQNTTTLCPITDFDGRAIYRPGRAPDQVEIEKRRADFHAPYHAALQTELDRVRTIHGFALLFDCHSIRSNIPFLFDGTLPDFNFGSADGTSCAPEIVALTKSVPIAESGYSLVYNGRFKGGWTTRHYGQPKIGQHALQLELAQSSYMQEAAPWHYDPDKAQRLRAVLRPLLSSLSNWRPK